MKLHAPWAGKLPPVRLIELVPEIVDPAPHTSFIGRPSAARPPSVASRSLTKAMSLAAWSRLRLLMVKSRESDSPGGIGSPEKNPLRLSCSTVTSSTALAFPVERLPPSKNISGSVVFPIAPATLAVTSTLVIQLASPVRMPTKKKISLAPGCAVIGGPSVVSQVLFTFVGLATTIPAGNTFRNDRLCNGVVGRVFSIE